MPPRFPFNYIITIHNKEELLERVLAGVAKCAGPEAKIIPVLDGCTDGSEAIARHFAAASAVETVILTAPDVHEIKSLNIGLRQAQPGYCVLIQDDVILEEERLEERVRELCEKHEHKLGYISFRLAANAHKASLCLRLRASLSPRLRLWWSALKPYIKEHDVVAGPQEALNVKKVPFYEFQERMIGIKSPVCLTPELRAVAPCLDEDFAPCGGMDEFELSLRALRAGLTNGLFAIPFTSKPEWGTTHKILGLRDGRPSHAVLKRQLVWKKYGDFVAACKARRKL